MSITHFLACFLERIVLHYTPFSHSALPASAQPTSRPNYKYIAVHSSVSALRCITGMHAQRIYHALCSVAYKRICMYLQNASVAVRLPRRKLCENHIRRAWQPTGTCLSTSFAPSPGLYESLHATSIEALMRSQ